MLPAPSLFCAAGRYPDQKQRLHLHLQHTATYTLLTLATGSGVSPHTHTVTVRDPPFSGSTFSPPPQLGHGLAGLGALEGQQSGGKTHQRTGHKERATRSREQRGNGPPHWSGMAASPPFFDHHRSRHMGIWRGLFWYCHLANLLSATELL